MRYYFDSRIPRATIRRNQQHNARPRQPSPAALKTLLRLLRRPTRRNWHRFCLLAAKF